MARVIILCYVFQTLEYVFLFCVAYTSRLEKLTYTTIIYKIGLSIHTYNKSVIRQQEVRKLLLIGQKQKIRSVPKALKLMQNHRKPQKIVIILYIYTKY